MKFLNIGTLEFVFILLLILVVLGPRKAVKTAGELGNLIKKVTGSQFWKDLVNTSEEIRDLPRKMMDEAELQETINSLDRKVGEVKGIVKKDQTDINKQVGEVTRTIGEKASVRPDTEEN